MVCSMKVGFIGLGSMGYSMASRLAEKGFTLFVYNRSREKSLKFSREWGAEVCRSPADAASLSDVVHIMVSDDEALMDVLLGGKGVLREVRGKVVVQSSTVTPMASYRAYLLTKESGGRFVEAPVLGSISEAREGRLISFIGGESRDAELMSVKAYSSKVMYVGPVPQASVIKLAINAMFLTITASLGEAVALAESWGVEYGKLFSALKVSWMRGIVERYENRSLNPQFPTRFKMVLAAKDLSYAFRALRYRGFTSLIFPAVTNTYLAASASGMDSRDYSHVVLYLRDLVRGKLIKSLSSTP